MDKWSYVREDGVSFEEAYAKCYRHYVMRGDDPKSVEEMLNRSSMSCEKLFELYDIIVWEEREGLYPVC